MRIGAVVALVAAMVAGACSGRGLFRDYEYEEELYLSLDGRATIYVNSSVAALVALRGAPLEARPNLPVDRSAVRAYFATRSSAITSELLVRPADPSDASIESAASTGARVAPVRTSRRRGRPFVHVRVDIDDLRQASEMAAFAWSSYQFEKKGDALVFHQTIGAASGGVPARVKWNGDERVAFRLHLPSRILFHNSTERVERGNILGWEQTLADRLRGVPLMIEVRMEEESILFRTLSLFAGAIAAVALMFGVVIWWVRNKAG